MDIPAIMEKVGARNTHINITGGEPTLQNLGPLADALHKDGRYISIETNGTKEIPEEWNIDWITCSPKDRWFPKVPLKIKRMNEVKVVMGVGDEVPNHYKRILSAEHYYLQPINGDLEINKANAVYVAGKAMSDDWQYSLQLHKVVDLP